MNESKQTGAQRAEFLFEHYQQLTSLLPTQEVKNRCHARRGEA